MAAAEHLANLRLSSVIDKAPIVYFEGRPGEDLNDFLNKLYVILNALGVSANEALKLFPIFLRGRALDKYMELPIELRNGQNFEDFILQYTAVLYDPMHAERAQEMMENISRMKNESLRDFAKRVESLVRSAHPHFQDPEVRIEAKSHFISKLPTKMRTNVRRQNPKTLEETIRAAEREELIMEDEIAEINAITEKVASVSLEAKVNAIQQQLTDVTRQIKNVFGSRNQGGQPPHQLQGRGRGWRFGTRRTWFGSSAPTPGMRQTPNFGGFNNADGFRGRGFSRGFRRGQFRGRGGFRGRGRGQRNSVFTLHEDDVNEVPSTSSSGINSVVKLLPFIVMLLLFCPAFAEIQLTDCSVTTTFQAVQRPIPPRCQMEWTEQPNETMVNLFRRNIFVHQVSGLACTRERIRLCTEGLIKMFSKDTIHLLDPIAMSPELCRQVGNTRLYNGQILEPSVRVNQFSTKFNLETTVPWFGTECVERERIVVTYGQIYSNDGKTLLSNIGSMEGCNSSEGYCIQRSSTIVFTPFHIAAKCFFKRIPEVRTAIINGEIVWLKEANVIEMMSKESLTEEEEECLGKGTVKLQNGLYMVMDGHRKKRYTIISHKKEQGTMQNTEETSTTMETLSDLSDALNDEINELYARLEYADEKFRNASQEQKIWNEKMLKQMNKTDKRVFNLTEDVLRIMVNVKKTSKNWKEPFEEMQWKIQQQEEVQTDATATLSNLTSLYSGQIKQTMDAVNQLREELQILEERMEILNLRHNHSWNNTMLHLKNNYEADHQILQNLTSEMENSNKIIQEVHQLNQQRSIAMQEEISSVLKKIEEELRQIRADVAESIKKENEQQKKDKNEMMQSETSRQKNWTTVWEIFSRCTEQRITMEGKLAKLEQNPTLGMREILNVKDITARPAGNGIYLVAKCLLIKVHSNDLHTNFELNGRCYDKWPVLIGNQVLFVIPSTNEVTRKAKELPCHEKPIIVSQVEDNWYYGAQRGPEPWNLDVMNMLTHDDSIRNRNTRFAGQFLDWIGEIETTITNATNDWAQSAYQTTIDTIETGAETIKDAAVDAYEKTTTVIQDSLTFIWTWIKWILIYIGIPLLVILLLIGCCVIQVKIWFLRKATQGISDNIRNLTRNQEINAVHEQHQEDVEMNPIAEVQRNRPHYYSYLPVLPRQIVAPVITSSCAGNMYVAVHVNGHPVVTLFDTGAEVSYCRQSTAKQLGFLHDMIHTTREASAANGTHIRFLGEANILLSIGSRHYSVKMLISPDKSCPAPMLLGMDTMTEISKKGDTIVLDLKQGHILVGKEKIKLLKKGERGFQHGAIFNVKLEKNEIIQAHSDNVVFAQPSVTCPRTCNLLFEGKNMDANENILYGRTLSNPDKKGRIPIRVINVGNKDISLAKDKHIGTVEVIPDVLYEINAVYKVQGDNFTSAETSWEKKLPELPTKMSDSQFLNEKLDMKNTTFTREQQKRLRKLILQYKDAFVWADGLIGHYKGPIKHTIPFKEDEKPWKRNYPIPLGKRKEVEQQLKILLDQGIIKPSQSEFCSPVCLVKKKDGKSWRFTVDYRGINSVTKPAKYILPRISDIVNVAAGKVIYSIADLQSAYFQVDVSEEDAQKTAFGTHCGLFEFTRMPMGLCGAPGTFQRIMEDIKRQMQAVLLVYLDDIIIMSENAEKHLLDIEEMLRTIVRNGLKIRLDKTFFGLDKVKYLGYIISKEGIEVDKDKTEIIDKFPKPNNVTDVRSFLGCCNYFRRFIKNYAKIAQPLTDLTKADIEFQWTEHQETAFQTLKNALRTAPLLRAPEPNKPYIMETDASKTAIAAVLLQEHDGQNHPVSYFSRRLTPTEQRYAALEIESLAICAACEHFRPLIWGSTTRIITDHRPLCAILQRKDLTGRLSKYQISMQEFDVEIQYRPGRQNSVADTLSRYPPDEDQGINAVQQALLSPSIIPWSF